MPGDATAPRLEEAAAPGDWSAPYLRARSLEGRLYPDALVATLPDVPRAHPLAAEWRLRRDSAQRLVAYLRGLEQPLRVVDVGCGNGWLASAIARIDGSEVAGLDGNLLELRQAARVFGDVPNLQFLAGDAAVADSPLPEPTVIVLASAIQYVEDLPALLRRLLGWLTPSGELHLLDSPLYRPEEVDGARVRTRRHYEQLGVPEMVELYHHHTWSELEGFDVDALYRPDAPGTRVERRLLGRPRSPFPWLRIRPQRAQQP